MDIQKEIIRYSKLNGYDSTDYVHLVCECGNNTFNLFSDDEEGAAYATCVACKKEHDLGDSREYMANKQQNICNCDNVSLQIGIGKSFYENSKDVRWYYIGCGCDTCGLVGVYVDWNER